MERSPFRTVCDAAAVLSVGVLTISGIALRKATLWPMMNPAMPRDPFVPVMGLSTGSWTALHTGAMVILLIALVPNFFIHWSALAGKILRKPVAGSPLRALAGLIGIVGLIGFVFLRGPVDYNPLANAARTQLSTPTLEIQRVMDAMTLKTIAQMGVPESYMRQQLGLGKEVSSDTPMSFLMPRYNFDYDKVQEAIYSYQASQGKPKK